MISPEVQAGAELLDKKKPGWEKLIDLDTLDMNSNTDCILAQLYSEWYWTGVNELDLRTGADQQKCGFLGDLDEEADNSFVQLTVEWKELIEGRRK